MATFEIQAPDGKKYKVEGETQEGALAALKKMTAAPAGDPLKTDRSQWGLMEHINNVVNQFGTGFNKGLAGIAGAPQAVAASGMFEPPPGPIADQVRGLRETGAKALPSYDDISGFMQNQLGIPFAEPGGRGEKLLQAAGMGATGIMFPGGAAPNLVGGVAGGVGSEAAGQMTEGTPYEPLARIAGGAIPAFAGSYLTNRLMASNAEQFLSKATTDYTPDEWLAAARLQSDAAARGAPITSAEALAQIKGGNPALMSMQRTVEQMPETSGRMQQFMSARPAGNERALAGQLDDLAAARPAADVGDDIQALGQRHIQNTYGPTVDAAAARAEQARRGIGPTLGAEDAGRVIQQRLRQGADVADDARAVAAGPQFTAARASDAVVNTDDVTAVAARYMLGEKGRMQTLAQEALATMRVGGRIGGAPDTSVSGLMASRKALNDMISAETRTGNNEAVRMLMDIRGRLDDALAQVPDVAGANDTFRLLSRELTDRYETPTVAPLVERDQFGRNLTMPAEKVPGRITAGGASGVDDFTAAADRTALDAYRQNLSRDILTKATNADGAVDPAALRRVLADNDDLLRRFPEIRERFSTVGRAQAELDEAYSILRDAGDSPIGSIAQTPDWKKHVATILDDSPGAERRAADLVRQLSQADTPGGAQRVAELLRVKIQDTFNRSLPNAKAGGPQLRGANLASNLSKNPQALRSLESAVRALPNGETTWGGFRRLLDVFEAQGQRLPAGSSTSFNLQFAGDLERNIGKTAKSLGVDMWARWNVQRRSQELARILTDPEGVNLLRELAVLGPNTARAQQLVQAFYQGAQGAQPKSRTVTPSLQQTP